MKKFSCISLMVAVALLSVAHLGAQDTTTPPTTTPPAAPPAKPKNWNNGLGSALSHSRDQATKANAKETDPVKLAQLEEEKKRRHLVAIMDVSFGHESGEI